MAEKKKSTSSAKFVLIVVATVCICSVIGTTVAGLSIYGIQSVQRSQRDTERRAAIQNINLEIASYYGENGEYPVTLLVTEFGQKVTIPQGNSPEVDIELKGNAIIKQSLTTTNSGTLYCYERISKDKYRLGVYLELSEWGAVGTSNQLGNDSKPCTTPLEVHF